MFLIAGAHSLEIEIQEQHAIKRILDIRLSTIYIWRIRREPMVRQVWNDLTWAYVFMYVTISPLQLSFF